MVRTVISLDEDDKQWLDQRAAQAGISMTELIRRAVRRLREEHERAAKLETLLGATRGIGSGEDGLVVQRRLRDEWKRGSA